MVPSINYEKCISCGKCVDFCSLGVYAIEEKNRKKRSIVKNPYSYIVLCNGCDEICPAGAITHPSKKETQRIIEKLKKVNA